MICRPLSPQSSDGRRSVRAAYVVRMAVVTGILGTAIAPQISAATAPATGRSHVWLAGGTDSDARQLRMTRQIRAIATTLRAMNSAGTMRIKVALPEAGASGREAAEQGEALLAITRVYGTAGGLMHSHASAPVGATEAGRLAQLLDSDFASMAPADRGLFVFSGQGQSDPADRASDALMLADRSRLTVRELDQLATRAPVAAPLRFLFTQCQTPGFMRLMRPSAQDVRTLSPYNRCGFAADVPAPKVEECVTVTSAGHPADYTSVFFAALGARGQVTLHDAHLSAVLNSDSAERPTATSEAFLERWQPTWMRYVDTSSERLANEYGEVASALGRKLGLPEGGQALTAAIRKQRHDHEARQEQIDQALLRADNDIAQLQRTIRRVLTDRWPQAENASTSAKEAFALIQAQPAYPDLVARLQQREGLLNDRADVARALAQLDKLVRLRQLARLQDQFERFADATARRDYERINRCERTPL